MNAKTMSLNLILLVMFLLTACTDVETIETVLPTEPEAIDEAPPVVDQVEDQVEEKVKDESVELQTPLTAQEETPSLEELSVITSQNAHALTQIYKLDKVIKDFAWSPDGKMIAFVSTHRIFLFDTETFEEIELATSESYFSFSHISFSPNGDLIAVSNQGNPKSRVEIYNIQSHDRLMTLDIPEDGSTAVSLAFSPDNTMLAAACGLNWGMGQGAGIRIWNVITGELIVDLGKENDISILYLDYNHDGSLLAATNETGIVYIWDMNTMQVIEQFWGSIECHYNGAISYSPDDKILAIAGMGSAKESVKLLDSKTKDTIYDLTLDGDEYIISLAFNPTGDVLASASYDDPWFREGDVLASASYDSVRLWDTRTGQQLAVMDVKRATRAAFNPDGTILATGGGDRLRLWGTSETAANTSDTEVDLLPPREALSSTEITQRAEAFKAITAANAEAWNIKDFNAMQAILTEDIHFIDVSFRDDIKGIEDVMAMAHGVCEIAPDLQRRITSHYIGVDQGIAFYDYWNIWNPFTGYTPEDPFIYVFLYETQGDLISYWRLFEGFEMLDKHFLNDNAANALQAMIAAYTSAWSSKDPEAMAQIYAEDAIRNDALFEENQQGLAEIQTFARSFFSWYPNIQWTSYEVFGEKRFEGKPQTIGSSYGIQTASPTGETCEVMAVVLLQVLDGKIVQEDLYYDADTLIQCGWAQ